jgi:rRNA-processing protein FCF1
MEVILDSSFIVSAMLARIDFLTELKKSGFKVVVPREVVQELKDLKFRKGQSREVRAAIDAAIEIFDSNKVKKIGFGAGKVDDKLIEKGKAGAYIATLDKGIQREVPNRVVILSANKSIRIERD